MSCALRGSADLARACEKPSHSETESERLIVVELDCDSLSVRGDARLPTSRAAPPVVSHSSVLAWYSNGLDVPEMDFSVLVVCSWISPPWLSRTVTLGGVEILRESW